MNITVVLLSFFLTIAPYGGTQKLRGPSSKPKRTVHVNMGHHNPHCRPYRLKRYSRRYSHIPHPPRQIIIVVQAPKVATKKASPKPKAAVAPRHRTIHIGSQSRRTMPRAKTRNQILKESKAKVRS